MTRGQRMSESFFERPILNSPYSCPPRHWELDEDGQPTNRIIATQRRSELITPVPKPQRRRRSPGQAELGFGVGDGLSTAEQEYNPTPIINEIRGYVAAWRNLPNPSQKYSRAFLVITPGITIKDRLRVLQPNDPNSYYRERELVPNDMLGDIERAKIVITNYHDFRRRERIEVSKTGRALLQGRGPELNTLETEGQMLQRACGDLMGLKNIVVLSDEAHHCYREKPRADDGEKLKGEDKEEAKKNNEAARLWISGIETVKRKLGLAAVYDLSATPFFLRGSAYAAATPFPWTARP